MYGSMIGLIKGDTRSLDYSSYELESKLMKKGYVGEYIGKYHRGY